MGRGDREPRGSPIDRPAGVLGELSDGSCLRCRLCGRYRSARSSTAIGRQGTAVSGISRFGSANPVRSGCRVNGLAGAGLVQRYSRFRFAGEAVVSHELSVRSLRTTEQAIRRRLARSRNAREGAVCESRRWRSSPLLDDDAGSTLGRLGRHEVVLDAVAEGVGEALDR